MRTDSDRNLSAEADPNPARKTRERVLTLEIRTFPNRYVSPKFGLQDQKGETP